LRFAVPEAPSAVKALVMSGDSILVSWKPPEQPNGIVSQYTVYVREDSAEAKDVCVTCLSGVLCEYSNFSHISFGEGSLKSQLSEFIFSLTNQLCFL
jgi:hypothetical protein